MLPDSGTVAVVMEVLKKLVSALLILLLQRLKIWCGQGSMGDPEWTVFMRSDVSWVVSWFHVVSQWSGLFPVGSQWSRKAEGRAVV